MAILFMDSCAINDALIKWDIILGPTYLGGVSPSGRGAYMIDAAGQSSPLRKDIPPTSNVMLGFYGKFSGVRSNAISFHTDNRATRHITVGVTAAGLPYISLNGGATLETSATPVNLGFWHYWEIRSTVHDSTGIVQVWIDGQMVINFVGDTRNGGTSTDIDSVLFTGNTFASWDGSDFRISDDVTPLGPSNIWNHLPNGNGNSSGLMGNDADQTDNYLLVDETTTNTDEDTTYVSSETEGDLDLYSMIDLPVGDWDILGLQVGIVSKVESAGSKFCRPVIRTGGANFVGTSVSVSPEYFCRREIWDENPDTELPWVEADIDGLEVGMEVRDS